MARVERLGSSELFLLTAVALALGTATVSALLGLSPALGAFLAGLLLTETEFDHRVIAEVVPMRDLFATLFFVSVGMLIDPALRPGQPAGGAGAGGVHHRWSRRSSRWSRCCRSGWAARRPSSPRWA